jgi:large subunit ribosomal protein L34e
MPAGREKSGRFRKISVKTPGSKTVVHYRERKPSKHICGSCGAGLAGVPRERPAKMANMPRTAKRPERPYGGVLCSKCMRNQVKQQARSEK